MLSDLDKACVDVTIEFMQDPISISDGPPPTVAQGRAAYPVSLQVLVRFQAVGLTFKLKTHLVKESCRMTKRDTITLCIVVAAFIGTILYIVYSGINEANEYRKHASQQAFKDGYNCAGAGIPVKANPHYTDSHTYLSWQRGWIAGKMKKVNLYEE